MDRPSLIGWAEDGLPNIAATDGTVSNGSVTVQTPTLQQASTSSSSHPFSQPSSAAGRISATAGSGGGFPSLWPPIPPLTIPPMQSRPSSTVPQIRGASVSGTTGSAQQDEGRQTKKRKLASNAGKKSRKGANGNNARQSQAAVPSPASTLITPPLGNATTSAPPSRTTAPPRTPQSAGWHNTSISGLITDPDIPTATNSPSQPPQTLHIMSAPPEATYPSFEDLLTSVQKVAEDQGYRVVKLRSSNYRDGKPTRFDLVCDRGGVKYNSTSKKTKAPTTRKIDCPWRGKAVCEVSSNNQWRFIVQDATHNHEPRPPIAPVAISGGVDGNGDVNGNAAAAAAAAAAAVTQQSLRTLMNKFDRLQHDLGQGFGKQLDAFQGHFDGILGRLDQLEKRLDAWEQNGIASSSTNRLPMINGQGSLMDTRLESIGARMNQIERAQSGLDLAMDDVGSGGLLDETGL